MKKTGCFLLLLSLIFGLTNLVFTDTYGDFTYSINSDRTVQQRLY